MVHLLNQASRLLNCDSTQHFKTDPYGCQMRDSIMEHLHLNRGFPSLVFRRLKRHEPRSTLAINNSSTTRPAELSPTGARRQICCAAGRNLPPPLQFAVLVS